MFWLWIHIFVSCLVVSHVLFFSMSHVSFKFLLFSPLAFFFFNLNFAFWLYFVLLVLLLLCLASFLSALFFGSLDLFGLMLLDFCIQLWVNKAHLLFSPDLASCLSAFVSTHPFHSLLFKPPCDNILHILTYECCWSAAVYLSVHRAVRVSSWRTIEWHSHSNLLKHESAPFIT